MEKVPVFRNAARDLGEGPVPPPPCSCA